MSAGHNAEPVGRYWKNWVRQAVSNMRYNNINFGSVVIQQEQTSYVLQFFATGCMPQDAEEDRGDAGWMTSKSGLV